MFKIAINNKDFYVSKDKTLLDSIVENGFNVNHSCRSGRCKECVANLKVNEKYTDILACEYLPSPNEEFYFKTMDKIVLPKKQIFPAKIENIIKISNNYLLINLKIPPQKKFNFLAGQYFNVYRKGIGYRSYSISSNNKMSTLSFIVQKVRNGVFSNYWFHNSNIGDLLQIQGPFGSFYLRQSPEILSKKHIFAATGSGIGPILSIIDSQKILKTDEITVFWSVKYNNEVFEPKNIMSENLNFKLEKYITREKNKIYKSGRIVMPIVDNIKASLEDKIHEYVIYACGNEMFLSSLVDECKSIENAKIKIYSDIFYESGD